jgi:6-phosphogluconate dehydrogenase
MKIGVVGLGKMGQLIVQRLENAGHTVTGFDIHTISPVQHRASSLSALVQENTIIWLMIPHTAVDQTLVEILPLIKANTIIIDGGNSNFRDTMRRAEQCKSKNISYIDVGVSGGIIAQDGFCLMLGGEKILIDTLQPLWNALSAPNATVYCGPSGSGHYVKMIHNGIEYGMLQAYAEGIMILHDGPVSIENSSAIIDAWNHGALISSKLLTLFKEALESPAIDSISGKINESGMGAWMAHEAFQSKIPTPVLHAALQVRALSRKSGGNFATKLIALVRYIFGGHTIEKQ